MWFIKIVISAFLIILYLHGRPVYTNFTFRVVGGFDCHPRLLPYLVSIQTGHYTVYCGGTLLNPLWVLTAAHCCVNRFARYFVFAGLTDLKRHNIQMALVKRIIPNKNFTIYPWGSDICLLELETPIKESRHTKYVRLPTPSSYKKLMEYSRCNRSLSLGFGYRGIVYENKTAEPPGMKTVLQCVFQRILADEYCHVKDVKVDLSTMLCVRGNPTGTADTCQGDSGGPLLCQGFQVGIVAAGIGCGLGYPSFFTKTAPFEDFIKEHVPLNITATSSSLVIKLNLTFLGTCLYVVTFSICLPVFLI